MGCITFYQGRIYDNRSMKTLSFGIWWLRIATFLLAALAAASATYWALKWTTNATPTPSAASTISAPVQTDPLLVARLLGGGQVAVVASVSDRVASRFKLIGVVASGAKGGYALIATDGQPAKPYRVGTAVSDALILQSVGTRNATLGASAQAPAAFTLELPVLARSEGKAPAKTDSAPEVTGEVKPEVTPQRASAAKSRNRAARSGSTD